MPDHPLARAHRLLDEAFDALAAAAGPGADDATLLSALTVAEGAARRTSRITVGVVADLERRGVFAARGCRHSATALRDLLGWDRSDAARHLTVAQHVRPRFGLDGTPLPPRLPATAAVFEAGVAGLRHVEVVARLLDSEAAARLGSEAWAGAEAQLAEWIRDCSVHELQVRGTQLIDTLDADGAEPDDEPRPAVNELRLTHHPDGRGGTIKGTYGDAAMFDAIAGLIDATAAPRTADDDRTAAQRQAEALADACGYVLDHGDTAHAPAGGGRRPHLNIIVTLDDLQNRARAAVLDFGGALSAASLRMLCCDAGVIPIVMGSASRPLDVGRMTRTIPDGIRRAVTARDRGCARCGRLPSWTEIHHVIAWQDGGPTCVDNCVMVCRACHRLIHHAGGDVRLVDGTAEFYPRRGSTRTAAPDDDHRPSPRRPDMDDPTMIVTRLRAWRRGGGSSRSS